jgi:hypothetical protein
MALHVIKLKSHEPRGILTTWEHLLVPTIVVIDDSCEDMIYESGL